MSLQFSFVVFLTVHFSLLAIVAPLPVTQTSAAIPQTHETDTKEVRIPVQASTFGDKNAESQISTVTVKNPPSSTSSESEEKIDENAGKEEEEELRACTVGNVTYQHREQIPRNDPCEKCVCVDSEMYCLWKLCNFFKASPTPASVPSSVTLTNSQPTKQTIDDIKITSTKQSETENVKMNEIAEETDEKFSKMLTDQRKYNALKKLKTTTSPKNTITPEKPTSTEKAATPTEQPTVCYVMGVMYKLGEVLPKDTGTCLECACSEGGRVTCSPKDCVSQPDLDYLSHNNNLDMFDLDTF